jgi:anti-anti-sigma factor
MKGVTNILELHEPTASTVEQQDNRPALVGDFDIFLSGELESKINEFASSGGPLCIDLTDCTYVDSTILTVLVRAAKSYGDRLEIVAPSTGSVARILALTKLDTYLPLV